MASLYGLSDGGPDPASLAPVKPFMFTHIVPRGTQVKAGDALKVDGVVAAVGRKALPTSVP